MYEYTKIILIFAERRLIATNGNTHNKLSTQEQDNKKILRDG